MNGKKLLAVMLICGASAMASAQGLVGAPVDPRYGQSAAVSGAAAKTAGAQHPGTARMVLSALMMALRIVRL
jgi:hypothetical protein